MNMFLHMPIADLYGPYFLILYGLFIVAAVCYTPIAPCTDGGCRLPLVAIPFWQERGAKLSDTVSGLVKRGVGPAAAPAPAAAA